MLKKMHTQVKSPLLIGLFLFVFNTLFGQISYTAEDLPAIGDTILFGVAEDVNFPLGNPGSNQVWDFRFLIPQGILKNIYINPDSTEFGADFPEATIALLVESQPPAFTFLKQGEQQVDILGLTIEVEELGGTQVVPFSDPQLFNVLPTELGSNFSDTAVLVVQFTEPTTQSELTLKTVQYSQISTDAEGQVELPGGTYNALRQEVITERIDSLFFELFGQQNFFDREVSIDTLYTWISPDSKGLLVTYDSSGSVTYYAPELALLQAPIAQFDFIEQDNGLINFQDQSSNMPSSWNWDFGDGSNSTVTNPNHQYDSTGTFQVCLTVSNVIGQDSSCQNLNIIVTDIDNLLETQQFNVFPNPSDQLLTFELQQVDFQPTNIQVFNAHGQPIFNASLNGTLRVPVESWSPGFYFYRLQKGNHILKTGKILIAH